MSLVSVEDVHYNVEEYVNGYFLIGQHLIQHGISVISSVF